MDFVNTEGPGAVAWPGTAAAVGPGAVRMACGGGPSEPQWAIAAAVGPGVAGRGSRGGGGVGIKVPTC